MAIGQDTSYSGSSQIYVKQQSAGTTLNGNKILTEEVTDTYGLQNLWGLQAWHNTVMAQQAVISAAAGGTQYYCVVTIQVTDGLGSGAITGTPIDLDVILSDNATGIGVTATAPSTSATITQGTSLNTYVTNKAYYAQCDTNGIIKLTIIDSAKTPYYIMVQGAMLPVPFVYGPLTTAQYHA